MAGQCLSELEFPLSGSGSDASRAAAVSSVFSGGHEPGWLPLCTGRGCGRVLRERLRWPSFFPELVNEPDDTRFNPSGIHQTVHPRENLARLLSHLGDASYFTGLGRA